MKNSSALPLLDGYPDLAGMLHDGMARVEAGLRGLLAASGPELSKAALAVVERPGKRIRPLVALMSGLAAQGRIDARLVRAAVAIEALHLASLLHDDVVDMSPLRSGQPTVNAALGNTAAVILGDFFFARALHGAAQLDTLFLRQLLSAAEALTRGEFGQTFAAWRLPSTGQYLRWVEAKTARLFAVAAVTGLGRKAQEQRQITAMIRYGRALGMAFQLRDDLLDLTASEHATGKRGFSDCRRGIFTYPIIFALTREPSFWPRLAKGEGGGKEGRAELSACLQRTQAVAAAQETCRAWAGRACACLGGIRPGPAREALSQLAHWVGISL